MPNSLQNEWGLWYKQKGGKANSAESRESYANSVKNIADFSTVEGFWNLWDRLEQPDASSSPTELSVFKKGISPTWEDAANRAGGKWVLKMPKGLSSHYFEEILLNIVGEQFDVGNEINGVVLSVRFSESVLAIWNRNANNSIARDKIRDSLKGMLRLPPNVVLIYKQHDAQINDSRLKGGRSAYMSTGYSGSQGGQQPAIALSAGRMAQVSRGNMGQNTRAANLGGGANPRRDTRGGNPYHPQQGGPMQQPQGHSRAPKGRWR